ncbi:MAG: hypothetical protein QE279_10945 [Rhodoferax sp.]|nr:hypothetical protein [Rhodoferax sp.]
MHTKPLAMLRNITLTAEDALIDRARAIAAENHTTLNVAFRDWLAAYVAGQDRAAVERFRGVMAQLGATDAGRTFSRDEMNER